MKFGTENHQVLAFTFACIYFKSQLKLSLTSINVEDLSQKLHWRMDFRQGLFYANVQGTLDRPFSACSKRKKKTMHTRISIVSV